MNSNSDLSVRLARALKNANDIQLAGDDQELLNDLRGDAAIILKDSSSFRAETVLPLCQELEAIVENHETDATITDAVASSSSLFMPPSPASIQQDLSAKFQELSSSFAIARNNASTPSPSSAPPAYAHISRPSELITGKVVLPPTTNDEITTFLSSASFKTPLPPCPTIIKAPEPGRWIELRCHICGGNATQLALTPLRGLEAFSTHLRYFHGVQKVSDVRTMRKCWFRDVDEKEVRGILEVGRSVGAPFVEAVAVSKEKRQDLKDNTKVQAGGVPGRKDGKKTAAPKKEDKDEEDAEYVADMGSSSASSKKTDRPAEADTNSRRSSRIADIRRAVGQTIPQRSVPSAAKKAKRVRKRSEEETGHEIDRLWWDVEERIYKTEQDVWLADLNDKAKVEGLLESRKAYRGTAGENKKSNDGAETDDPTGETA
ncbi:hypothetical protein CERZMDRAFT_89285 [Cercospora zeae-maydis SCOH1-5]|uniref:Uncharacterized protein n=1 Tax=Cercospora zeae-maydis SCOH1-5 TaxID=717836 RepID=A0A6A6EYB0_9PEZI|nr:hypothetical protein CERZMDRAFT_89285 [Cercospora zeae-maydis SCOH1-5]